MVKLDHFLIRYISFPSNFLEIFMWKARNIGKTLVLLEFIKMIGKVRRQLFFGK
jgi:hypothetical protein